MKGKYLTKRGKSLLISVSLFVGSLLIWPALYGLIPNIPYKISITILFLVFAILGLISGIANLTEGDGPFATDWVTNVRGNK